MAKKTVAAKKRNVKVERKPLLIRKKLLNNNC